MENTPYYNQNPYTTTYHNQMVPTTTEKRPLSHRSQTSRNRTLLQPEHSKIRLPRDAPRPLKKKYSRMLLLECSCNAALGEVLLEQCWRAALGMLRLECCSCHGAGGVLGVLLEVLVISWLTGSLCPEIRNGHS